MITTQAKELEIYENSAQQIELKNIHSSHTNHTLYHNEHVSPKSNNSTNCNGIQNANSSDSPVSNHTTVIQLKNKNINDKNITIIKSFHDFEIETSNFMEEPGMTTGSNAINLGRKYVGYCEYFLNALKEYNSFAPTYKSLNRSEYMGKDDFPNKQIENEIKHNIPVTKIFEYLHNLTLFLTGVYFANEDAIVSIEEYNSKCNVT